MWKVWKKLAGDDQRVSRESATINPAKSMDIGPKKTLHMQQSLYPFMHPYQCGACMSTFRHHFIGLPYFLQFS